MMGDDLIQTLAAFLMASSLTLIVFLLIEGRKNRVDQRLRQLSGKGGGETAAAQFAQGALPRMGSALEPTDEDDRTRLQARLLHAGLYNRQAMYVYLGVKLLLTLVPLVAGVLAALTDLVPMEYALLGGAAGGVLGMIGPSFWLDGRKTDRQRSLRRALPDALDVLVICLEGGLSLTAAVKRVGGELGSAHPALAAELRIVEREVQLGRGTGEALRAFGDRADLEELRHLASVITQSERFGASLVKALRVHAQVMREKRLQYAEEMAQKAATKILFPTLFCIFPGVFIVILAPAAFQIWEWMGNGGK